MTSSINGKESSTNIAAEIFIVAPPTLVTFTPRMTPPLFPQYEIARVI